MLPFAKGAGGASFSFFISSSILVNGLSSSSGPQPGLVPSHLHQARLSSPPPSFSKPACFCFGWCSCLSLDSGHSQTLESQHSGSSSSSPSSPFPGHCCLQLPFPKGQTQTMLPFPKGAPILLHPFAKSWTTSLHPFAKGWTTSLHPFAKGCCSAGLGCPSTPHSCGAVRLLCEQLDFVRWYQPPSSFQLCFDFPWRPALFCCFSTSRRDGMW